MSNETDRVYDIAALEAMLDRYGADRTRWPAADRNGFASLIAMNAEARRRVREAELLDRLLDLAPGAPSAERAAALSDRIMSAAVRNAEPSPKLAQTQDVASVAALRAARPLESPTNARRDWQTAALLAASLVLGVLGGGSGAFDSSLEPIMAGAVQATSSEAASSETEIDTGQLALSADDAQYFEEDLL